MIPDFWRQLDWYTPKKYDSVLVIGCGSIGSYHAYSLARMGVPNITVVDYDTVEEHNLPNQFFSEIGLSGQIYKVDALVKTTSMMLQKNPIKGVIGRAEHLINQLASKNRFKVISITVDSMAARKSIYNEIKKSTYVDTDVCIIDGRVGGMYANVFNIKLFNSRECSYYEENLWEDKDVPELPCSAQAIVETSYLVAGAMTSQVRKCLSDKRNVVHTFHDFEISQSYVMRAVDMEAQSSVMPVNPSKKTDDVIDDVIDSVDETENNETNEGESNETI